MNTCSRVLCLLFLLAGVTWATPQNPLISGLEKIKQTSVTGQTGSSDPGADIDSDGLRNSDDRCGSSDLRPTVFISGCDTGVNNTLDANGCSLNDHIAKIVASASDKGELVQRIAEMARQYGLAHDAQARMVACAIEAEFGEPELSGLGTGEVIPGVDSDGDGFLDTADSCPFSDFTDEIVIGECETGVANRLGDFGCTLSDSIEILIVLSDSTSSFVHRLQTFTNAGLKSGLLNQAEADALLACGAQLDYDFNLDPDGDQDGDGVRNDVDDCPYSINHPIVVLDGCFTGVNNVAITESCTLIDLILAEARSTTDRGVFLAGLAELTDTLIADGFINLADAEAIEQCAVNFELPIDFDEGSGDGSGDDGSGDGSGDDGSGDDSDDDGDGVPNQDDECAFSNTDPTVTIAGCDSGVPNLVLDDGCTLNDIINDLANQATSHGNFVSLVTQFTNALRADGLISGAEKGAIVSCAGQSNIGGDNGQGDGQGDGSGDDGQGDGSGDDGSSDDGQGDGSGDDGAGDGSGDDGSDPVDRDDPYDDGQDDGSDDDQGDTPADDCGENENLPIDADPCVADDASADDATEQDDGESSSVTHLDNGRYTHGNLPSKPDDDGDGIPNHLDVQPLSDLTDVVVIDGCDSGVANRLLPNGKTLTDLVDEFAASSGHHTEFVGAINHLAINLQQQNHLSDREAGLLRLCAMRTAAARGEGYGTIETDRDADGFADDSEAWSSSNLQTYLRLQGEVTPVANMAFGDGTTLADRLTLLADFSEDDVFFSKGLTLLTNRWVRLGYISPADRALLMSRISANERQPAHQ